jgi:Tol biopolymer transport system component
MISPDGRKIAFLAFSGARPGVWVHSLDSGTAELLANTEDIGPATVTWSPDSRFLAYSAVGSLKKIAATGGPSQVICALRGVGSGAWGSKDVILVDEGGRLTRVPASGGEPVPATALGENELHRHPRFLPDGRRYLYLATAKNGGRSAAYVGDLESDVRRELPGIASEVQYSPTGHVLFMRDGSLVAQGFDVDRLELAGEPFVVAERFADPQATTGGFSVSTNGTVAFRSRRASDQQLTWFDRSGKRLGTVGPAGSRMDIELSPDAAHVVFEGPRSENQGGDIWVLDAGRGVTSRVTSHPSREADPVWSPDGATIVFRSDRDGGHLYQRGFRAVGEDTLFFKGGGREEPSSWSPDGRFLIYQSGTDIWALPLNGERQPIRVTETSFQEWDGRVSPDGRWIAYSSNEAGRAEVYVQSFPKPGLKQQVSAGSGTIPRWSHDGRELYYASIDLTLMAVSVERAGDAVRFGAPAPLFALDVSRADAGPYAVSSNGRFLVNVATSDLENPPITVILNWASGR